MYSKIERGERKAKRSQIPIMAKLFEIDEKELLTIWLADKVLDTVENEDEIKSDAIKYAQNVINAEQQCILASYTKTVLMRFLKVSCITLSKM